MIAESTSLVRVAVLLPWSARLRGPVPVPVPGSCAWDTWGHSATHTESSFPPALTDRTSDTYCPSTLAISLTLYNGTRYKAVCYATSAGLPKGTYVGQPLYTAIQYSISLFLLSSSFGTCTSCSCKAHSPRSQHPPGHYTWVISASYLRRTACGPSCCWRNVP